MTDRELENWAKVKSHLESEGLQDCYFYKRACLILEGQPDPLLDKFEE